MNKKSLIITGGIIVLVAAGLAYVFLNKEQQEPATPATEQTSEQQSETPPKSDETNNIPGAYVDYSAEAVAQAKGDKILFFYAPWCPQCRAAEQSINQSNLPDNLTIFKVDYDSNQALRQKYGVTLQTTFVKVDDRDSKVKSYVAYDEPTFDAVKRELLP